MATWKEVTDYILKNECRPAAAAEHFGVSRQAISCSLKVYEAKTGQKIPKFPDNRRTGLVMCESCGTIFRVGKHEITKGRRFCTNRCKGDAQSLSDDFVESLIQMRRSGQSWQTIAIQSNRTYANVTTIVWRYLWRKGRAVEIPTIWGTAKYGRLTNSLPQGRSIYA